MKKFLIVTALGFSLSGCVSTGSTQVNQTIADVQAAAQAACSFVPSVASVSAVLTAAGVPYVGIASEVALQICAAVARRSGSSITVRINGRAVPITGRYIRRR